MKLLKSLLLIASLVASACEAKVEEFIPSQNNVIGVQQPEVSIEQLPQLEEAKLDFGVISATVLTLAGYVCARAYQKEFERSGKRDFELLAFVPFAGISLLAGLCYWPQIKDPQLPLLKRAKAAFLSMTAFGAASAFAHSMWKIF